jgi:hypothetical protein
MNALKADPKSVDLRALATHFYRLGVRVLQVFEDEELVDLLADVCAVSCLVSPYIPRTNSVWGRLLDLQETRYEDRRPCE